VYGARSTASLRSHVGIAWHIWKAAPPNQPPFLRRLSAAGFAHRPWIALAKPAPSRRSDAGSRSLQSLVESLLIKNWYSPLAGPRTRPRDDLAVDQLHHGFQGEVPPRDRHAKARHAHGHVGGGTRCFHTTGLPQSWPSRRPILSLARPSDASVFQHVPRLSAPGQNPRGTHRCWSDRSRACSVAMQRKPSAALAEAGPPTARVPINRWRDIISGRAVRSPQGYMPVVCRLVLSGVFGDRNVNAKLQYRGRLLPPLWHVPR